VKKRDLSYSQSAGNKKNNPEDQILLEIKDIGSIRNQIIDSLYLISGIVGALALWGSFMRTRTQGWDYSVIYYIFLFLYVWVVYFSRKKLSLNFKSITYSIIFFVAATILNVVNGIVSGAVQFIFITIIVTLLYGWKLGIASVLLSLIVRTIIAVLYIKGVIVNSYDSNAYAFIVPNIIPMLLGAFFVGAVSVFIINKFYQWLFLVVQQLSIKAFELTQTNIELIKAKKKAEEHDRLKTVFLANMSHEIRTPMNAIIGFSSFLGKSDLASEKRERFSALIQERSYDLLRIIEDILDISKIEIGQMKLIESEVGIADLLKEIDDYYRIKISKVDKKNDLVLVLKIPEEIKKLSIKIDAPRLKQIINNLIDNALKFTNSGTIEFGCNLVSGPSLEFYVKDTGIGIAKEKQGIIFDRFRQADESITSRQFGGSGLGLSIVKGLVDIMHGRIRLESELNKGSTFYITLPFVIVNQASNPSLNDKHDENFNWKGKTVLLVEDDDANTEYLKELFSGKGTTIYHSSSGAGAKNIIEKLKKVDLILMDVRLPDISGLELTREIKMKFPKQVIIAHTAYAGSDDLKECIDAGCDDYISKPINQKQFNKLIESYLMK
jgi:signal transduction histidine kinase/CheY-like chemotaxis protein